MHSAADKIRGQQLEILKHLADGKKREEIASEMGLALGTVNDYCNRLYKRLGAHTSTQALANFLRSRQPNLPFN